jgi:fumarate reductase subunit C
MMRELTAVFVAIYCIALLIILWRIKSSNQGGAVFDELLATLQTPWSVALHFLALIAAMYHKITWFALVPKVMVVRMGEEKLAPAWLVLAHWALWLVISAGILLFVFRREGAGDPPRPRPYPLPTVTPVPPESK